MSVPTLKSFIHINLQHVKTRSTRTTTAQLLVIFVNLKAKIVKYATDNFLCLEKYTKRYIEKETNSLLEIWTKIDKTTNFFSSLKKNIFNELKVSNISMKRINLLIPNT